ncbi:GDP-6-deoxy-D-mannose reductase [compost metagenome]
MKALITGVSGFVGTYLSQKLLENGYDVVGIARSKRVDDKNINFISCDITDELKLQQILKSERPDEIYHLAGSAFVPLTYKEPQQTYNTIANGTLTLYEAIRRVDLYSSKVLYVGSAAVYGEGTGIPFTELDSLEPNNPYAGAKACADLISDQYVKSYKMKIVRVRPFNHTGPGQSPAFVCSNFAKQIAQLEHEGNNVIHVGNINVKRDFLDVRDVVDAYYMLMQHGLSGEVYNVSSQKAVSVSELLNLLSLHSKIESLDIKVDNDKIRPNETLVKIGDNRKIRLEIGWEPLRDIKQTMIELLEYWRSHIHVLSNEGVNQYWTK